MSHRPSEESSKSEADPPQETSSSTKQENIRPEEDKSAPADTTASRILSRRRPATPNQAPPPVLRSGSTTCGTISTNDTSTESIEARRLSEARPHDDASESIEHVEHLEESQEEKSETPRPDDDGRALKVEKYDSSVRLPSPGTIRTQMERVKEWSRRTSRGETGIFLTVKRDAKTPSKTTPKTILEQRLHPPYVHVTKRQPRHYLNDDIIFRLKEKIENGEGPGGNPDGSDKSDHDDYYAEDLPFDYHFTRLYGIRIIISPFIEVVYIVSDPVLFERWLARQSIDRERRPDLRVEATQRIIMSNVVDIRGPALGVDLWGSIGAEIQSTTTPATYRIVDNLRFWRWLSTKDELSDEYPPVTTVEDLPRVHWHDWVETAPEEQQIVYLEKCGILLFPGNASTRAWYMVKDQQLFQNWLDSRDVHRDGDEERYPYITPPTNRLFDGRSFTHEPSKYSLEYALTAIPPEPLPERNPEAAVVNITDATEVKAPEVISTEVSVMEVSVIEVSAPEVIESPEITKSEVSEVATGRFEGLSIEDLYDP